MIPLFCVVLFSIGCVQYKNIFIYIHFLFLLAVFSTSAARWHLHAANTTEKYPGSSQMSCNILWTPTPNGGASVGGSTFILYSLILGFALPLSLILVFYYLVIKKLQTVGPKNKSKDKKRSHRKVTRLVLTVITVYILCWSPYWVGVLFFGANFTEWHNIFIYANYDESERKVENVNDVRWAKATLNFHHRFSPWNFQYSCS